MISRMSGRLYSGTSRPESGNSPSCPLRCQCGRRRLRRRWATFARCTDRWPRGVGAPLPTKGHALRRALLPEAEAGADFLVRDDAAGLDVGEPGIDGLADVDLIHEIIPCGVVGELIDEASRFGLDIHKTGSGEAGICHGARQPATSKSGRTLASAERCVHLQAASQKAGNARLRSYTLRRSDVMTSLNIARDSCSS